MACLEVPCLTRLCVVSARAPSALIRYTIRLIRAQRTAIPYNATVCTGVGYKKGVDPSIENAEKVSVAPGELLDERARGLVCVSRKDEDKHSESRDNSFRETSGGDNLLKIFTRSKLECLVAMWGPAMQSSSSTPIRSAPVNQSELSMFHNPLL
ncbi:hypothetical protein BC826DRAFT_695731 [Russula brevipes]|nr:hypothetical protein BC826DRAFT_695731 [Russula brevipes]